MINIVIIFDKAIAGVLRQDMVKYGALRVNYFNQGLDVNTLRTSENDRLHFTLDILQVLEEVIHVVALVDKDRLANFLKHELVLWVLKGRLGDVAGVFIADEGVQQHVIKLEEKSQGAVGFLRIDRLHRGQDHRFVHYAQVLEYAS